MENNNGKVIALPLAQKFNWGWGLALFYSSFVLFMLFMVYKSVQMKTELVTKDYYKEELNYQSHIDKVNRTSQLATPLQWKVTEGGVLFLFPDEVKQLPIQATVKFYCPSNGKNDKTLNMAVNNGTGTLNTTGVAKGSYKMQVEWSSNDKAYYNEGVIVVN